MYHVTVNIVVEAIFPPTKAICMPLRRIAICAALVRIMTHVFPSAKPISRVIACVQMLSEHAAATLFVLWCPPIFGDVEFGTPEPALLEQPESCPDLCAQRKLDPRLDVTVRELYLVHALYPTTGVLERSLWIRSLDVLLLAYQSQSPILYDHIFGCDVVCILIVQVICASSTRNKITIWTLQANSPRGGIQ